MQVREWTSNQFIERYVALVDGSPGLEEMKHTKALEFVAMVGHAGDAELAFLRLL